MSSVAEKPIIRVIREGDTSKRNPFTIVVVANPALEAPWRSGIFVTDPIAGDQAAFDGCVASINESLFGDLPGQAEKFLAAPEIGSRIRLVSLFIDDLPAEDINALIGQDDVSNIAVARRTVFRPFLARFDLSADIAYAVTASATHRRASAWFTSDDDGQGGIRFTLDGTELFHRYEHLIPGTVALPVTSTSLTAMHEFGHALSSYTNGMVVDLYVDGREGLNNQRGQPIPPRFGTYNGESIPSDLSRNGLGYPPNWQSYHCALIDPSNPAVMDDYWKAGSGPEACRHDAITRKFLADRLLAKISRP